MDRLNRPHGVENGQVQPSPETHPPEGFYLGMTLLEMAGK
jgi:hypothetical protein